MTKPTLLLSLLACVLLSGCTLCRNIQRTILDEPTEFSWMADRDESVEVYRTWADEAWREQGVSGPGQCDSRAYAAGFKDGFVDYVYGGGSGEPPPVPPRAFWNVEVRNPRGRSEAADWFAGYRHGAQVAREEGYRKRALVPLSMFLMGMSEEDRSEEGRANQPYNAQPYNQPVPAPFAEPLQPEYILPGQIQPETIPNPSSNPGIEAPEPEQLPATATPNKGLPDVDTPAIEAPTIDTPAEERLPQPPTELEESPLPQQPGPIENPPEKTTPPTDFDDIFGSSAQARKPQALQRTTFQRATFERAINKEVSVQQARSAFASAIRSRSASHNPSNTQPLNAKPLHASRSSTRASNTRSRHRSTSARRPRPVAIPKSKDRAQEMFQRLSP